MKRLKKNSILSSSLIFMTSMRDFLRLLCLSSFKNGKYINLSQTSSLFFQLLKVDFPKAYKRLTRGCRALNLSSSPSLIILAFVDVVILVFVQGMAASKHVHQTLHLVNWTSHEHMHDIQEFIHIFSSEATLYSKCPSVRMSETFLGKRDFLGSYERQKAETSCHHS